MDSFYIFNLDDDILTENRTLETMIEVIQEYDAVTALEGRLILFLDYNNPVLSQHHFLPVENVVQGCDFLVGSYGMKLEYVKIFRRYRYLMKRNGEDIHLSITNAIECNRQSMIRKKSDESGYVSLPDDFSSYAKPGHMQHRGQLLRTWILSGYKVHKSNSTKGFPLLTNQTIEYCKNRIRYLDYT